ncbi:hypothetical protein [Blackfly microvirus SF02]|uniref:Uncharacterized protein n=1 Tax=Blackfly microvirus SF02 TaxID=2576452 RepID=A0A4V1F5F9_9VIRU|nr:hypothetical protein [Blackfly microvirus SF02]
MATKFRTRINAVKEKSKPEQQKNKVSATVPDQVPPMRKIFDNYQKGLPLKVNSKTPVYNPDFMYKDLDRYDLADIQAIKEQVAQDIDDLKSKQDALKTEKTRVAKALNEASQRQRDPKPTETEA